MTENLNRLAGLRARPKSDSPETLRAAEAVGEALGFVDRAPHQDAPRKKPGRKASPRTYQLHPKVRPDVGEALAAEAERLGVTQGALIEAMWVLYSRQSE